MEEKLQELLSQVFTPSGNVKACGRETCKDLISLASFFHPDINFGNPDTGMMNVENFRKSFFSNV